MREAVERRAEGAAVGDRVAHETPLAHRGLGAEPQPERRVGHAHLRGVPKAGHRVERDSAVGIAQLPLIDLRLAKQHVAGHTHLSQLVQLHQDQTDEAGLLLQCDAALSVEYALVDPKRRERLRARTVEMVPDGRLADDSPDHLGRGGMSKVGADDLIAAGATVADFESLPRVEVDLAAACARGPPLSDARTPLRVSGILRDQHRLS